VTQANLPILESTLGMTSPAWLGLVHHATTFDPDGRTVSSQVTNLYSGEPDDWRETTWDVVGAEVQMTEVTHQDAVTDRTDYAWTDARGRLTRLHDAAANQTSYSRDLRGRMVGITDAAGNDTTITYDSWGRKLTLADPDLVCDRRAPFWPCRVAVS